MSTIGLRVRTAKAQDENKLASGKVADKSKAAPAAKRSALSSITNIAVNQDKVVKPKADKPVVTGRVPLVATKAPSFKADKPVVAEIPVNAQPTTYIDMAQEETVVVPLAEPTTHKEDLMMIDDEDEEDEVEDIDAKDHCDPLCCTEYINDIFEYCRLKEAKDAIVPNYMAKQVDINEKMRGILVDWMVEVHVKFKLLTETMFLSVCLIDRFLSMKPVARNKLQLVGITSLLIASKFEEIFAPEVRDFIYISDSAYKREEILKMERMMLSTFDFNLSTPTPLHFLRRFSKAAKNDLRTHALCKYLTELTLTEYKMIAYLPSQIAAAAIYIARLMTDKQPWTATLEKYTTFKESDIRPCVLDLNEILHRAEKNSLKAVRKKYLSPKLMEPAKIPPVEIL